MKLAMQRKGFILCNCSKNWSLQDAEEVIDVRNISKVGYLPLIFENVGSPVIRVYWKAQGVEDIC